MFVVNDKGSSWAYATPGFGAPLGAGLLRQLRDMAGVGDVAAQSKCHTEVRTAGAVGSGVLLCAVAAAGGLHRLCEVALTPLSAALAAARPNR
jgi:hypothetical protein